MYQKKNPTRGDFPGGPVVKNLPCTEGHSSVHRGVNPHMCLTTCMYPFGNLKYTVLMYACIYTYNHSILAIKSAQTKLIEQ